MSDKIERDRQRRVLQSKGWEAAKGLKRNGAFKWIWIHPQRKKAYSRIEAFNIAKRSK